MVWIGLLPKNMFVGCEPPKNILIIYFYITKYNVFAFVAEPANKLAIDAEPNVTIKFALFEPVYISPKLLIKLPLKLPLNMFGLEPVMLIVAPVAPILTLPACNDAVPPA